MENTKQFIKTFLLVSVILWAFAGLFIYHFFFNNKDTKGVSNEPAVESSEYLILIITKIDSPSFFLLKISDEPEIINLPSNLLVRYEGEEKQIEDFYSYAGAEYAAQAIGNICGLDGYVSLKDGDFFDFINSCTGANVNLKTDMGPLKSGRQKILGQDIKYLDEYANSLTFYGKMNALGNFSVDIVNGIVFNKYIFSVDALYERVTEYGRTDINAREFKDISKRLTEIRNNGKKAKATFISGDFADDYFTLSDSSMSLIQKRYDEN